MTTPTRFFALALLTSLLACARPAGADVFTPRPQAADTATLFISGSGSVRLPSDRVRLTLSVESSAPTVADASGRVADVSDRVFTALRPLLAEDDRIETTGYRVEPVYARPEPGQEPVVRGYRASNSVVIVSSRVDDAGTLLDAALEAGANRISGLAFFAVDDTDARMEAISLAVRSARAEAEATAQALDMVLGPVLEVRSGTNSSTPPGMMMDTFAEAAPMRAATPIEAGSNVVSANVSITWRLLSPDRP